MHVNYTWLHKQLKAYITKIKFNFQFKVDVSNIRTKQIQTKITFYPLFKIVQKIP